MAVQAKTVATDAGAGALAGSAFGPEGTVIGGVLGGAYGVISGLGSGGGVGTSGGDADSGPRGNFALGSHNALSPYANQLAQGYESQGGQYQSSADSSYRNAQNAYNQGLYAQNRGIAQVGLSQADQARQLAALGGLSSSAGALQSLGTAPMGPSVAAAQLQAGQDQAARQSLAMARSGRTLGSGAAAMQSAQFQNAQSQQATNQQAAMAALQEQQSYRQMQVAALGGANQGYGAAAQQANAITGSNLGVQTTNAGLNQQQQQINNQTTQAFGQLGASQAGMAQGLTGAALQEQQLGFNTRAAQLQASENYQSSIEGNSIAQQGLNNQQTGMFLGAAGGAANAYAQYEGSDRDAKKNIKPANGEVAEEPWYSSWGAFARALGDGSSAPSVPPSAVRNPNNPSQYVSPFAPIGAAANAAHSNAVRVGLTPPDYGLDYSRPAAPPPLYAPGTPPPSTWGGELQASDERAKSNVRITATPSGSPYPDGKQRPAESPYQPIADASRYAGRVTFTRTPRGAPYPYTASDERSKTRITELEGQLAALGGARPELRAPDTAALDNAYRREGGEPVASPQQPPIDLRPAQGYSYEYRDPTRFGQGRFYGPMAQDLERTPAGASTVKQAPDGTKMVDTSRLALVNTAAISDLQKQLAALSARTEYPTPSAPDYDRIDLYRGMQRGGAY